MPNIKAKDADGSTIFLKSSKANSDEAPAISQEDLLDSLGLPADAASTTTGTLIAHARAIRDKLPGKGSAGTANADVLTIQGIASGTAVPISGTVTANLGTLLTPGVARQLAAGSTSTNTQLTTSCQRISILATGADIRYSIGSSSQTASATSHYIAAGERLDLGLPTTPNIAVIRAGSINGTLELTEFL